MNIFSYKGKLFYSLSFSHTQHQFYKQINSLLSRTIYEKLASAVTEDQRAIYTQRVDDISPNIRYCAYNIGGDMPTDVNQLMEMMNISDIASKIDVCFRGRLRERLRGWSRGWGKLLNKVSQHCIV